jgi:capsular polysaccharide biosynthesis protein
MARSDGSHAMELRDYLKMLSRRRYIIVAVTLAVTAAAITAGLLSANVATSRAVVTVPSVRADGVIVPMAADVSLERELEVARSAQVMSLAAEATGESVASLGLLVSISPASATSRGTIAFTATDADPDRAAALANSVAESYVTFTNAALLADLERHREAVRAGSEEATAESLFFLERLDATTFELAELSVGRGATSLDTRLADLSALIGMDTSHAQLVNPAEPTSTDGGLTRNAVLGLTLGLFLGIAAAFVQEQVDDRVRRVEMVREVVPDVPVFDASESDSRSSADAVRLLAIALAGDFRGRESVLAVTSPTAAVQSADVAAALAEALAERGERVTALSWGPSGESMADRLKHATALRLAEAITMCADPAARDALRVLRSESGVVVVDAAPVLGGADAGHLAGEVDGVVLAARSGTTRIAELRESAGLLKELGMPLRAIVLLGAGAPQR